MVRKSDLDALATIGLFRDADYSLAVQHHVLAEQVRSRLSAHVVKVSKKRTRAQR